MTGEEKILLVSARLLMAVLCVLAVVAGRSEAEEHQIRVAAASDLNFAMRELSEQFESRTGVKVTVTYGSSGNFFSQIQNGAPFDLFFSADMGYARKLEAVGLAEPGSIYQYAVGRIVIWIPSDGKIDVSKEGWKALLDRRVEKIAIANPEHAPYGRAAVAALQKAGIYEAIKAKLVFGENISQAAQFVQSGTAQAGITAMSLAVSPAMRDGKRWEIPAEMHPALEQGAVLLKNAKDKKTAWTFLEFAKSDAGRATLAKYGFEIPVEQQRTK